MPADPPQGWHPRRGEVYLAALDKLRPVLVVSVDALNRHALDVCIVSFSSVEHPEFDLRVSIAAGDGGLRHDSWAKCDQVTSILKTVLQYPPLGVLSDEALHAVEEGIRWALGLISEPGVLL